MVTYEWVYETLDENGEIENVDHSDKIDELPNARLDVALVRDDEGGRSWAYVKDCELPASMLDSFDRFVCRVPKKYKAQFDRFVANKVTQ